MSPRDIRVDEEDTYSNADREENHNMEIETDDTDSDDELPALIPMREITQMIEAENASVQQLLPNLQREGQNNTNNNNNNARETNNNQILNQQEISDTNDNNNNIRREEPPIHALSQGTAASPAIWREQDTMYRRLLESSHKDKISKINQYPVCQQISLIESNLVHLQKAEKDKPQSVNKVTTRKPKSLRNPTKHIKQPKYIRYTSTHQTKLDDLNDAIETKTKAEIMRQTWGHPLRIQDNWPANNKNNTLRVATVNINGISSNNNYLEMEAIIGQMMEQQIDILCLTELNLDVHKKDVYNNIWEKIKSIDRHIDINTRTSSHKSRIPNSTFKPGGTMILTSSAWSGRRIRDFKEPKTQDTFGRWTTTHLRCQSGKAITIINWYRVNNDKNNNKAGNTIYMQQTNQLERKYNRVMDPRKSITKDIKKYIRDIIARGNYVLLVGDTNEHLQQQNNEIQTLIDELNMDNISIQQHPDTKLPSTYDRGPNCLDIIAGTQNVVEIVQATGFLPFYIPFCTDHRLGFVDLNARKLFGSTKQDTTKEIFHGFHTKNVHKCNEYLNELEEQYERHKIFQKVTTMKQRINTYLSSPKHNNEKETIIKEVCKLEKIRSELMFGSEAKCRKRKYQTKFPYSRKLVTAAKLLWTTKSLLRQIRLGNIASTEDEINNANQLQKRALLNLRCAQQSSVLFREEMLDSLALKLSLQWKVAHSSAIKIIRNAEAIQILFNRVSRTMKASRKGTIQYILQSKQQNPDENNEQDWDIVDQQDALNEAIINQNSNHLLKSNKAITAHGPLQKELGWQAENEETVQSLLDGTHEVIDTTHSKQELQRFIESIKTPNNASDEKTEMKWNFGLKEYKALYSKTRESTACGPSGLHMSHWKAAVERDNIAEVHAFFIWAAFALGFSYQRWQVSWHCMLQKRNKPFIHRLRIIQLFEGDFNGGLKYLLGKKLMQHMVNNNFIPNETFGSIPGRNATETMKLLQLFYENHRLLKQDMAIVFNDADGCYDRIRPNMVDITMRRLGLPHSIAAAHTDAQVKMRHHIKTANGISPEIIQWAPIPTDTMQCSEHKGTKRYTGNIGGLGQGGGGGPVGWLSILIVLLDAYHTLATSATLTDPIGLLTFSIYVLSYVDDNSLITSLATTMSMHEIVQLVQKNFEHWKHLLQITGGDLSLGKCTFSLMKWNHTKQQLHTMESMPGDITIDDNKIRRIEVDQAERQLGVRISLDGNFTDEYDYRLQRATELGRRIINSSLSTIGAHMAYSLYYKPMIQYPLSVTTFSDRECDKIHSKFVFRCLPKMGINRHMPRVVVFGPSKYGGMNLFDLKLEQLHRHLRTTKAHMRRQDQVGNGIISNINALQLISGSADNILLQDPDNFQYINSNTSLEYIWKASFKYKFKIHYNIQIPLAKFNHDINIMDYARTQAYTSEKLISINICRLYYKAIYLGDITDNTGTYLNRQYISHGFGNVTRHNALHQPPNPETWRWKTWNEFILKQFTKGDMSIIPNLGILNKDSLQNINDFEVGRYNQYNFHTIRDATSDSLKKFGGNMDIPPEEGAKLMMAIMETQLEGASDGSWKETDGIGTWGYAFAIFDPLRPLAENTNLVQRGSGNCMLHDATNAQTAEHYGAIAVLVFLYVLALTHKLTVEECEGKYVVIWIDNAEVQRRFNEKPTFTKVGTYVNADVELWTTIHLLKQKIPFTVVSRWVKGHQDKHTEFSELPFNAQLNVLADEAAEKQYNKNDTHDNTIHLHTGGVIYYRDERGKEITKLYQHIQNIRHGNNLREYIQTKHNWQEGTMNMIDWANLEATFNQLPITTVVQRSKMIHGWQNTGTQKKMILDSKKDHDEWDMEPRLALQCPMCKEPEDQLHYVHCQHNIMKQMRQSELQKLQKHLRNLQTYGDIIALWAQNINQQPPDNTFVINNSVDKLVDIANTQQSQIGWNNLLKGFMTKEWRVAQDEHLQQNHQSKDPQWAPKAIELLQSYTLTMWTFRNQYLHGIDTKENKQIRTAQLKAKVEALYASKDRIHVPIHENTFDLDLDKRLQCGHSSLITWIELATRRLKFHREEATKHNLDRWLIDKNGDTLASRERENEK